ncbi:hypothetical protein PA598K_03782 [Paenibacillus sp. 598K]|nr:hypothetical protein PA598K_03782 [Paenibacillus sp. 598K]
MHVEETLLSFLSIAYALECQTAKAVTNEMYCCTSAKGEYFVRVTNYKTYKEQKAELEWTAHLFEHGVGVPEIIRSVKHSLLERLTVEGKERLVVVFGAAPGIHLPRSRWDASVFGALGRQIGRMHRVSQGYIASGTTGQIGHWHESPEYDFGSAIPAEETRIHDIAIEVMAKVKALPQEESTYGLIHGDLWLENILVDDSSRLTMIDFQDCERHYLLYDLAVPIYSALEYSYTGSGSILEYERSITQALIDGYREEHELSAEMLAHLPLMLQLKQLFDYNLMHLYWDAESLSEEQVRLLNLYRMRIERMHA